MAKGGGGDAWPGKVSRSRTESPVSNDPVQQNKSMRTRSRQTSTENGDQQVEPVESNTQPRRRQRPQSTEPMECDVSQSSTNGIVIDKEKDEQCSESLQSVIGDDEIAIEDEKELSSTNGIVVNKEKDEQGNENLQSVIEDGQLAIEEDNDLSQTLHTENVNGKLQGNHKGLKKVNSNKKQIKYNERHSTWGIDNIPEELFEVNKDKSAKLTEFDVWKVEQSTKEVKINEKDFLQSTNLQTDNDVKSMNSNATNSIDDNKNRTEENLSENIEKCERFKYENQSEANLTKCERFKCDNQIDSNPDNDEDPVTEAIDVEQNNKQENSFEMSKSIATDLIVTDQENKNTSQRIYMVPNTWNFEGFPNLEIDEDRKIDKNMDTNVIENKENEVVFEKNSEDKVAFDRNQCDTWNFEGVPNLEIEDKNIEENMDSNIIENIDNEVVFEKNNEEKIAFDRNQCNTWNFEGVPNLEIEDKNNEENMDTNVIENKEN